MTASVANLSPGQYLTFKLNTTLITSDYTNVKLLGVIGYDIAQAVTDVTAIHANIYSSLPAGTPRSPDQLTYLYVQMQDGSKRAVSTAWILEPISIIQQAIHVVTIPGLSVAEGAGLIKSALNAYGITDYTVTVSTP